MPSHEDDQPETKKDDAFTLVECGRDAREKGKRRDQVSRRYTWYGEPMNAMRNIDDSIEKLDEKVTNSTWS